MLFTVFRCTVQLTSVRSEEVRSNQNNALPGYGRDDVDDGD